MDTRPDAGLWKLLILGSTVFGNGWFAMKRQIPHMRLYFNWPQALLHFKRLVLFRDRFLVINKQGDYLENILSPNLWEWKNASGVTIYQGEQLYPEDEKEIFSICSSAIYITEELKEYVKNGFRTPEDIKFNESQLLAWIAIIISIILGLAGIALNIIQIILSKIQ